MFYKGKSINIAEGTVIGSPSWYLEVNPDLSGVDISIYKEPKIYTLLDGTRLDFTGASAAAQWGRPEAYKELNEKLFVFKRCQM